MQTSGSTAFHAFRPHHHSRVLHSNTGGCGSQGSANAMVVLETDFDLRFHEVGSRLNSPDNLSFLGSSDAPVFRIPEVGWRILIFDSNREFPSAFAQQDPTAQSRYKKQQEGKGTFYLKQCTWSSHLTAPSHSSWNQSHGRSAVLGWLSERARSSSLMPLPLSVSSDALQMEC